MAATPPPPPNICRANREEQLRYAADIVQLYHADELNNLRDAEMAARPRKWHEKAVGVADKIFQSKALRGGETTGEKAVTALTFGVGSYLVRSGSIPVLRNILGAYSGMKAGEVIERSRFMDKKMYAELAPVGVADLQDFLSPGWPGDATKAKLPKNLRDTPEAARERVLARAREQIADPEFRKKDPVAYGELRNAVDQITQRRILSVRATQEEVRAVEATIADGDKRIFEAYRRKLDMLSRGDTMSAEEAREYQRKWEEKIRRRRVGMQLLGAACGAAMPTLTKEFLEWKAHRAASAGPSTLDGVTGASKTASRMSGGPLDAKDASRVSGGPVDTGPSSAKAKFTPSPKLAEDLTLITKERSSITQALADQLKDRTPGLSNARALSMAGDIALKHGDIHVFDSGGRELPADEVMKLRTTMSWKQIYGSYKIQETWEMKPGGHVTLTGDAGSGWSYTEQHGGETAHDPGTVEEDWERQYTRMPKPPIQTHAVQSLDPAALAPRTFTPVALPANLPALTVPEPLSFTETPSMAGGTMKETIDQARHLVESAYRATEDLTGRHTSHTQHFDRVNFDDPVPDHFSKDSLHDTLKDWQKVESDIKHVQQRAGLSEGDRQALSKIEGYAHDQVTELDSIQDKYKTGLKYAKTHGVEFREHGDTLEFKHPDKLPDDPIVVEDVATQLPPGRREAHLVQTLHNQRQAAEVPQPGRPPEPVPPRVESPVSAVREQTGSAADIPARAPAPRVESIALLDEVKSGNHSVGLSRDHVLMLDGKPVIDGTGRPFTLDKLDNVRISDTGATGNVMVETSGKIFVVGRASGIASMAEIRPVATPNTGGAMAAERAGEMSEVLRAKALEVFNSNAGYGEKMKAIEQAMQGLSEGQKIQVGPYDFMKENGRIFYVDTRGGKILLTPQEAQDLYQGWLRTQAGGQAAIENARMAPASPEQVNLPAEKLDVIRQAYPRQAQMVNTARGMMQGLFTATGAPLQGPSFDQYQAAHATDGLDFKTQKEFLDMVKQVGDKMPQFPNMDLSTVEQGELTDIGALNNQLDAATAGDPKAKAVFDHFIKIIERVTSAQPET